jgi:hypothetical protein
MGLGHYLGGPDRFCPPLRAAARWRGYAHEGRGDGFVVERERGFDSHSVVRVTAVVETLSDGGESSMLSAVSSRTLTRTDALTAEVYAANPNTVQLGHLVAFLRRFCEGRERNGARRWFPPASG